MELPVMTLPKHPVQPLIYDKDGILRFKENTVVRYLLDHGNIDLNMIAKLNFSQEDREQFAQLIGYSLNGASTLSYMSEDTLNRVDVPPKRTKKPTKTKKQKSNAFLGHVPNFMIGK
jgi:hypothetical protein